MFNSLLYNYYVDSSENYFLANFTFIITMSIGLFCLMLIPIDSYIISDIQELQIKEEEYSYSLKEIYLSKLNINYLVLYLILIFLAFFLIPFSYFYGNDEKFNESKQYVYIAPSTKERIIKSLRKTVSITSFNL